MTKPVFFCPILVCVFALIQEDLVAILPFLFLLLNTFPLTPAILPLVERVVPRKYFIPSQFEEEKLEAVRRLVILRDSQTDYE